MATTRPTPTRYAAAAERAARAADQHYRAARDASHWGAQDMRAAALSACEASAALAYASALAAYALAPHDADTDRARRASDAAALAVADARTWTGATVATA